MTGAAPTRWGGAWRRAGELAARTPVRRNRYVDFLRAVSIVVVVLGHWLMAAPSVDADELSLSHMLSVEPWSQWLTWIFQVMPLFFIVGGYSNAASWEAARRDGRGYAAWLGARLRRLIGPVVPLIVVWAGMAAVAHRVGTRPATIAIGSEAAFTPTWFLAVYLMVVIATPATHALWRRLGIASFWALALAAALVDALAFGRGGHDWLRWSNYAFVWIGVHQLGYAWRAGGLGRARTGLAWSAAAMLLLLGLVHLASYPIAMLTVPGEAVSNSRPPTVALLTLGVFQVGVARWFEARGRRWLRAEGPWRITVLVNGIIMTLYLWHVTAMVWVVGLATVMGGVGLHATPGSEVWWLARIPWIAVYTVALALCVAAFARFEAGAHARARAVVPAWRGVVGAACLCAGLAFFAQRGIGGPGFLGFHVVAVVFTLGAAALAVGARRLATTS